MKRFNSNLLTLVKIAVAVGLLLYLGYSGAIDWVALQGLGANWGIALFALLLLFGAVLANAQRLCVLFAPQGLSLTFFAAVRLTLIGWFFNACLPGATGGDLVRIYYASGDNPGKSPEVVTAIVVDRLLGFLALVLLPLLVILVVPGLVSSNQVVRNLIVSATVTFIILAAVLISCFRILTRPAIFGRIPVRFGLEKILNRANVILHSYGDKPGPLILATFIALSSHICTILAMLLIAQAIVPGGMVPSMLILIPVGIVANALPLTPGGLGVGEIAFNHLFALEGLSGGAGVLLGWRLLMIGLGLIGLVFYLSRRKQISASMVSPNKTQSKVSP